MSKMNVLGTEISYYRHEEDDYISLTDMVKNIENGLALIEKWLRNKNTIEFLGIWEEIYNPDFNSPEFEGIKNLAGLNRFATEADILNMALFGIIAADWRDKNPDIKGNIRDYADMSQLVCLSNLENLNALFIDEGLSQMERLLKLNKTAIHQMKLLTDDAQVKKLGTKK